MSGILFVVMLACVLILALILFSFDQSTAINMAQLVNLMGLLAYLFLGFTYSYFSETITANSFKIGEDAYNSLWNEMEIQQQKAIMLIIGRSQKEFRLTGLGLVDCTLATFLAVTVFFIRL